MTEDQEHLDEAEILQLMQTFLYADPQEAQHIITARQDIFLSEDVVIALRERIQHLQQKLTTLENAQKDYVGELAQSDDTNQQVQEDLPSATSFDDTTEVRTAQGYAEDQGPKDSHTQQEDSDPRIHIPQQPYIPRSDADTEALMASMTSEQLGQAMQMLGDLSNVEVVQLLRMIGISEQLSDGQVNALQSVMQQLQNMSEENKRQFVEQIKSISPEQLRTMTGTFKATTGTVKATTEMFTAGAQNSGDVQAEQAVQRIRNLNQEDLIEDLLKKGQIDESQKDLMRLYLQQFQSASDDQLKDYIETLLKARQSGEPIDTKRLQEFQISLMQNTLRAMPEKEQEALIENMLKMHQIDQIDEEHKKVLRLSLQQLQSASGDQLKDIAANISKAQPANEPFDIKRLQEFQTPFVQNMFRVTRDPESAIEAYTQELATLSREQDPLHWARVHCLRGAAYRMRTVGDPSVNLERALEDLNAGLDVLGTENAAQEWGSMVMMRASLYMDRKQGHFAENRQKAVADCEMAMHIFPRETFPQQWALAKLTRASANNALAHFTGHHGALLEEAIRDCDDALSFYTYQQQPEEWIGALVTRCFAHSQCEIGNLQEHKEQVIADANAVLSVMPKEKHTDDWALLHAYRAIAYWQRTAGIRQQNIAQAMADCEAALTIYASQYAPEKRALVLSNRAMIRMELGHGDPREHIEQSIHDLQDAVDILQKETQPLEWATAQLNCAGFYLKRIAGDRAQNWQFAYQRCKLALEVFDKERTPILWGQTLVRRGMARYGELPPEIQQVFENRLGMMELMQQGIEHVLQVHKGGFEVFRASYDDFDMALTVLTKENAPTEWALAHSARAQAYEMMNMGNSNAYSEQANEDYESAQTVFTPESKPFEWAWTQVGQASRLLLTPANQTSQTLKQKAEQALQHLDAALSIYTTQVAPTHYQNTQVLRALAYERLNNWQAAHRAWLEVRKVRRTLMTMALSEQNRTDQEMVLRNINIYKHDAQVLLRCTPPDVVEAVIALEEGRAQGLRLAFDLDSLDPEKIQNQQAKKRAKTLLAARDAWRQCQQQVERLLTEKNIVEFSEERQQYLLELQRAHEAFIQAGNAIREYDNPDFMSPVPTLTSIAQAVSAPSDALVYLVAGSHLGLGMTENLFGANADQGLAIIVMRDTQGEPRVHALALPLLTKLAVDGLFPLDDTAPINVDRVIKQVGELGMNDLVTTLHQWGVRRITFVPYGRLSLFPLAAIQVQSSNGETTYLGDLFEVSVAPSARSCEISRRRANEATRNRQRQGLCLVGNPFPLVDDIPELPWAEAEADIVRQIARAYSYPSARIRHLSRREATKQQVIEGLNMAQYAHLAMHGIYNVAKPLDSRLLLAGNLSVQEQERTITLGEILQGVIPLSELRLLVLSACDTSLIDLRRLPDEVIGLASGFLQAGVAGVIASLWRVDDIAAYLLMVRFAGHYLDPQGIWSPVHALTEAQRWLRQEATNRVLSTYDPLEDLLVPSLMPEESQRLYNKTVLAIRRRAKAQLETAADACPYADPKYWAAFMVTGC